VPDPHDSVRTKTTSSSPGVFRYFSRLGNWAGWGMGSRSKNPLTADAGGLKRWQIFFFQRYALYFICLKSLLQRASGMFDFFPSIFCSKPVNTSSYGGKRP
ncbi:signal-induced proliferation-associated 1-like protein 1, partial [Nephila pilipes]